MNEDNPAIATLSHHWLSPSQPLPLLRSLSSPWSHPLRSLQGTSSPHGLCVFLFFIFYRVEWVKLVVYGFGVLEAMVRSLTAVLLRQLSLGSMGALRFMGMLSFLNLDWGR